MLYGIALQAAREVAGGVAVAQVIVVPAAGISYSRSISTDFVPAAAAPASEARPDP